MNCDFEVSEASVKLRNLAFKVFNLIIIFFIIFIICANIVLLKIKIIFNKLN